MSSISNAWRYGVTLGGCLTRCSARRAIPGSLPMGDGALDNARILGSWKWDEGQTHLLAPRILPRGIASFAPMSDLLERLKTALADSYAIERELGSGGIATVYPARGGPALKRGLGHGA